MKSFKTLIAEVRETGKRYGYKGKQYNAPDRTNYFVSEKSVRLRPDLSSADLNHVFDNTLNFDELNSILDHKSFDSKIFLKMVGNASLNAYVSGAVHIHGHNKKVIQDSYIRKALKTINDRSKSGINAKVLAVAFKRKMVDVKYCEELYKSSKGNLRTVAFACMHNRPDLANYTMEHIRKTVKN